MTDPELFKYDVRVRDRMLRARRLTEAQVSSHLERLADASDRCETLVVNQPALGPTETELVPRPRVVAAPAVAAPASPAPVVEEPTSAEVDDAVVASEGVSEDARDEPAAAVDGPEPAAVAVEVPPAEGASSS